MFAMSGMASVSKPSFFFKAMSGSVGFDLGDMTEFLFVGCGNGKGGCGEDDDDAASFFFELSAVCPLRPGYLTCGLGEPAACSMLAAEVLSPVRPAVPVILL